MAGETRDDRDDRPAAAGADESPAALARIGHLGRLHVDEAELFFLAPARTVVLGRGAAHARREAAGTVALDVADEWMSAPHAAIEASGSGRGVTFTLRDRGSRNGVVLDGRKVASHVLRHGDVFVTGRTAWRFHGRPVAAPAELAALAARPWGGARSVAPALLAELRVLLRAAPSPLTILIGGETGTGKEVAARAVHGWSGRKGAFVAVNCAALPETLVEAQLFGHKKGAFTGATASSPGYFVAAEGGTLFLDEIGDMPLGAQAKLLRALETREVVPVGDVAPRPVDVRVVAATHADLRGRVAAGTFRADLLARLAQVTVALPPLRERREDLGTLLPFALGLAHATLSVDAARLLLAHDWPLNVRELLGAVHAAALMTADDRVIASAHLPPTLRPASPAVPAPASAATAPASPAAAPPSPVVADAGVSADVDVDVNVDAARPDVPAPPRAELEALLRRHSGNVTAAARELGKGKMQLYRWMRRRALDPSDFR